MGGLKSTVDILSEDGSSKTVEGIVRLTDNIFFVFELDKDTDRTEYLLLDDLHVWLGFSENSGLNGPESRISSDVSQGKRG